MFFITSSATIGVDAIPIQIETDISFGMSSFTIVGLPDASVKEARDRIRAALKNSGFTFPRGRVTVNLAPADLRKQGPLYDVPIALSILIAQGEIPASVFENTVVIGELALDGSIREVKGALVVGIMARKYNFKTLFVPKLNSIEVGIFPELISYGVTSLKEIIDFSLQNKTLDRVARTEIIKSEKNTTCFSFIKGQSLAKRGLEIAAAGNHNILLSGPPGTGKTLLAKSFPSILEDLSFEEMIEVTSIASIAGELQYGSGLISTPPFRSPHHSSSATALVGGGSWPAPGEISLAHRGVLFLDELPEFPRHVLEHLRQPLEDGVVTISRANASVKFPARFLLIAAMNPCPCGYLTDPKRVCTCNQFIIQRYQKKISGPLLDRFDLRIEVSNISQEEFLHEELSETSDKVRKRVVAAKSIQKERFKKTACHSNAEIPPEKISCWSNLTSDSKTLLGNAIQTQSLSPRAATRVQKVARTIADLSSSEFVEENHLAEALQFRQDLKWTR